MLLGLLSWPRQLCNVLFLVPVPPQLNSEHGGGVNGSRQTARLPDSRSALEGPPGAVLASGAGEGPAPPAGPAGAAASSGPRPPGCFTYFN